MVTNVASMYREIKTAYFPDWDPIDTWQVQLKTKLSNGYLGSGYCNRKKKTIEISRGFVPNDDNERRCLLLHQICHVIGRPNHGQKWTTRFQEIADFAERWEQRPLAKMIRGDIKASQDSMEPNTIPLRSNLEMMIAERPDIPFGVAIISAAATQGLTAQELMKRYPAVKKYYRKFRQAALKESNLTVGTEYSLKGREMSPIEDGRLIWTGSTIMLQLVPYSMRRKSSLYSGKM